MTAELTEITPIRLGSELKVRSKAKAQQLGTTLSAMIRCLLRREMGDVDWAREIVGREGEE